VTEHKRKKHQPSVQVGRIHVPRASDGLFYCPVDGCAGSDAVPRYLQKHFRLQHVSARQPSPKRPRLLVEVIVVTPTPACSARRNLAQPIVQVSDANSESDIDDLDVN